MLPHAAAIAANRFGLGARPGELARLVDPAGWLRDQLRAAPPLLDAGGLPDSARILVELQGLARQRRAAKRAASAGAADQLQQQAVKLRAWERAIYVAEVQARLRQAIAGDQPFLERLVWFWSNHFAVSADKGAVLPLAGAFEREAIRPHVLGNFGALLAAVEQHPAMLLYLDNQRSCGPHARLALRAQRRGDELGLNENLAREILELHTLGVDGGYSQADVTAFARVITGWSVATERTGRARFLSQGTPGRFLFRSELHEPGAQQLLGRRFARAGVAQGSEVLSVLATHPATAQHLATKLARHFIADDPPPEVVGRLARVWLGSGGDLTQVYAALIDAPQAWSAATAKFKTPGEYLVSIHRGLQLPAPEGAKAVAVLEQLGQRPYAPGSPAGWPDRSADWAGAAALNQRIEYANALAQRSAAQGDALALAPQLLGDTLGETTRQALQAAASPAQGLTLLLASPEFLRR